MSVVSWMLAFVYGCNALPKTKRRRGEGEKETARHSDTHVHVPTNFQLTLPLAGLTALAVFRGAALALSAALVRACGHHSELRCTECCGMEPTGGTVAESASRVAAIQRAVQVEVYLCHSTAAASRVLSGWPQLRHNHNRAWNGMRVSDNCVPHSTPCTK